MGPINVHVRCLTDGVVINGQRLRAGQDVDLSADDDLILKLRIAEAAGDITTDGLPDAEPIKTSRISLRDLDSGK